MDIKTDHHDWSLERIIMKVILIQAIIVVLFIFLVPNILRVVMA